MAVQINGVNVIYNAASSILCTGNQLTANSYGPNVHPAPSNVSASGTTSILLNQSQTFLTLTGNLTISISAVLSKGNISEIILDTGGYTPTFNASHFFWSADTEPTWADHQYWRITCVGLSSTTCVASATGYSLPGTTIPISGTGVTRTGQEASSGDDVAFCEDFTYSLDPVDNISSRASIGVSFRRDNIGGVSGFRIQVRKIYGFTALWYDSSGTSSSLGSPFQTIYENTTATPSAIRMVWSVIAQNTFGSSSYYSNNITTFGYVEGDWYSTATDGTSRYIVFESRSEADQFNSLTQNQLTYQIEFWGRSAGFDDTLLATYNISLESEAEVDAAGGS